MLITPEINAKINQLYEFGYRGDSNSYKGMPIEEEEKLISLLMKSYPYEDLPSIHDLDPSSAIFRMIANYINESSINHANEISNHLKNLYIPFFKNKINDLMDEKHMSSNRYEIEEHKREIERAIYKRDTQR